MKELQDTIKKRIERKQLTALGYTSNLDIVYELDTVIVNTLLAKHGISCGIICQEPTFQPVSSEKEFLETLVYYCLNGLGGERDISDASLLNCFGEGQKAVGGTAAQAALVLSGTGCPSLVHLTDDSDEVRGRMNTETIYTVDSLGRAVHTGQVKSRVGQEPHFIIQYKKGDEIELGDKTYVIPTSNRLILTKRGISELLPLSAKYFQYIEHHATCITSQVISGFNCILDLAVLKRRLSDTAAHISRYRAGNPAGIVYMEDAAYHDSVIRQSCMEHILPLTDIFGMNEEELADNARGMHMDTEIRDIDSVVCFARAFRRKYGVRRGIVVHTADYAVFVGDKGDMAVERGLYWGGLLATARASVGRYPTLEDVERVLALPISEKGAEFAAAISAGSYDDVQLIPTRYIDKPRFTIGLGDSFTAGMQICFGTETNGEVSIRDNTVRV